MAGRHCPNLCCWHRVSPAGPFTLCGADLAQAAHWCALRRAGCRSPRPGEEPLGEEPLEVTDPPWPTLALGTQATPGARVSVCLSAVPSCSEQVTVTLQRPQPLRVPQPGGLWRQQHAAPQQQQQHLHTRLLRAHPLRRAVRQGMGRAGRDCPTLATPVQVPSCPTVPQEHGGCPVGAEESCTYSCCLEVWSHQVSERSWWARCPLSWVHVCVPR